MEQQNKGSVFQQWHGALLENYILVLSLEIKKLASLPSSEFYIPEGDVDDLLELAKFFEIQIPESANLKEHRVFKQYLGEIKNKAKKIISEDLRPTDPYVDLIRELTGKVKEEDIRQLEGAPV